jgi:hypothetical protein
VEEERAKPDFHTTKRSESLTFRDALLERLATMRAKRMDKPKKEVRKGILDEIYTSIDG